MTDRLKGFLVTLDKEIRHDDAVKILNALSMIQGVQLVQPYVKNLEDYLAEQKGNLDMLNKFHQMLMELRVNLFCKKNNG